MSEKMFVRDPSMRSTYCKYDPCPIGKKCQSVCDKNYGLCLVSLISDRFLGARFEKNVLSRKFEKTKNLFTYNIIADTAGCNLNCWFCYAWKYLDLKDIKNIENGFLSAKQLAKQFDCKIRKTADLNYLKSRVGKKEFLSEKERINTIKHLKKELPFSRIRISGGEPLFSNKNFFFSQNATTDIIEQTIRYWVDFFEILDGLVGEIKKEEIINIANFDSEWQNLNHPVWLSEYDNRIMVRFDTNGIIFGIEKNVNLFFLELFKLFSKGKLNNIHIQIDFSFKGVTVKEFLWSQSKVLPATLENNDETIDFENHPQIKSYQNIISNISKYGRKNSQFRDCVSITVEKGIDHDWAKNKLWLYYPHSLDWKKLEEKFEFEFSDVVNCFDLNFGWNLNAKIHRYSNKGAMVELSSGKERVDTATVAVPELMEFRRQNIAHKDYMTLVYPTGNKIEIYKQKKNKVVRMPKIDLDSKNYWIITGSKENLKIGLENGLWGVKEESSELWDKIKENDHLFFYCTFPTSGIVGFGRAISKKTDKKPFWPNENQSKDSKYPLRISFKPIFVIDDWDKKRKSLHRTGIGYYHGLNYVDPEKINILNKIQEKLSLYN